MYIVLLDMGFRVSYIDLFLLKVVTWKLFVWESLLPIHASMSNQSLIFYDILPVITTVHTYLLK
jgi:hypothetical protein